jgi:hypothetical protein
MVSGGGPIHFHPRHVVPRAIVGEGAGIQARQSSTGVGLISDDELVIALAA